MNQTKNSVSIAGILSEINLEYGSYAKNGITKETIGGHINIKTKQMIDGKSVDLEIPVYMFSNKYKNDGGDNPAYKAVEDVMNNYKSIAAVGEEQADHVKVYVKTDAIRMNEYYNQNGQLVSYPRINASFVSKDMKKSDPEATFAAVFFIKTIGPEMDAQGIETGRTKIEGCTVDYAGKVSVMTFYSGNANVASVMNENWSVGDTVAATGALNFSTVTRTETEEQDFGDPITRTYTTSVSELLITGGQKNPLDGDFALNRADVKAGMEERAERLETLKMRAASKANTKSTPGQNSDDLGF